MKKNRVLIAGVITAFVALITLSLVSGTWAKYTSKVQGSDTARVAKWSFNYNGAALNSETITIDLFKDNYDGTVVAANKVVAPGTKGQTKFELKNMGEVKANAQIVLEITNLNEIPLTYKVDGVAQEVTGGKIIIDAVELGIGAEAKTITLSWEWPFETKDTGGNIIGDTTDTNLGKEGTATVTVKATVTFTQVD